MVLETLFPFQNNKKAISQVLWIDSLTHKQDIKIVFLILMLGMIVSKFFLPINYNLIEQLRFK